MADFCASCTETVMGAPRELNDFRGFALTHWVVVPCEGCGMHKVDAAGERICGEHPHADAMDRLCSVCVVITGLADALQNAGAEPSIEAALGQARVIVDDLRERSGTFDELIRIATSGEGQR